MIGRTASDAQSSNVQRRQCRSSDRSPNNTKGGLQRPPSSIDLPKFGIIINDTEAAEKISGCVIEPNLKEAMLIKSQDPPNSSVYLFALGS